MGPRAGVVPRRRRHREPAGPRWAAGGGARLGTSGVGDPACDTVIAWTFFSGASRDRFRAELDVDAATWSRGRGWGLWKALITLVGHLEHDAQEAAALIRREIDELLGSA